MANVSVGAYDQDPIGDRRISVKLTLISIFADVVVPGYATFFLSSARIMPLHDPTMSRSPTTVGVEKTQPPVSNSH